MGWDRGEGMYSHADPKIDYRDTLRGPTIKSKILHLGRPHHHRASDPLLLRPAAGSGQGGGGPTAASALLRVNGGNESACA
eukprot:COSAG01_NODE_65233_length_274_cov_0.531429_1_plen_80_part_10